MTRHQTKDKNGAWKGGRIIASNGYVLVRVGVEHHLADVRGYAYEHRLVAERVIGRRLIPGEVVHHIDHDTQNNAPDNLQVVTRKEHGAAHRSDLDAAIACLVSHAPHRREEIARLLNLPGRKVGWALSRLRQRGHVIRNDYGSWVATTGGS